MAAYSAQPKDDLSSRVADRPLLLVLASTYPRWAGDPEPGFVHELSRRLTGRFRVVVIGPHAPGALGQELLDGVEVHRYRYAPERWQTLVNDGGIVTNLRRSKWKWLLVPSFVLGQAWAAWRILRRENVDVIHAHWLLPQGLIAAALQHLPTQVVPFVATSHGADLYALKGCLPNTLKRFVAAKAAAVTVVSNAMGKELSGLGVDAGKVHVRSMGVDFQNRFVPDESVSRSRDELLFVGRLVEKKGLSYLLDAMLLVLAKHPDAVLTIAGFGPEQDALEDQASRLGIERNVCFLGAVPQERLPNLYRRAAVFVAPFVQAASGDQEGLGLVLVEAIGCGCPVVAGDVPAVRDVLGEGSSYCVDPRQPVALADAILRVLDDPYSTAHHAADLREALAERLDWERVADDYAKVLAGCCRHDDKRESV